MPRKRRRFRRLPGERPYRKMFVIATEGNKTEPLYFGIFNDQQSVIHVRCLKSKHESAPTHVLKKMENFLEGKALRKSDEAWLVVDKDNWTDEQLAELHAWSQKKDTYGFALSNPMFEYWLLLHFDDGTGMSSARAGADRLRRNLPGYDKGLDLRKITPERIDAAVRRAKLRDNPPCTDWPRSIGHTTVYRLVENILKE